MELVLNATPAAYEPPASRRRALWSHQIAAMSRRLESRWARSDDNASDSMLDEIRCASCAARVAFDTVMLELAEA